MLPSAVDWNACPPLPMAWIPFRELLLAVATTTAQRLLALGVAPERIAGDSCARTTWEAATLLYRLQGRINTHGPGCRACSFWTAGSVIEVDHPETHGSPLNHLPLRRYL